MKEHHFEVTLIGCSAVSFMGTEIASKYLGSSFCSLCRRAPTPAGFHRQWPEQAVAARTHAGEGQGRVYAVSHCFEDHKAAYDPGGVGRSARRDDRPRRERA